ncbi:MAG: hypothetical protein A3A86_08365 [Elusimicrobia bacterium RIFCSPLOWO2_01_FULL_60_11]|nr:MAG: hypothetical protein A3A86_08365 [Elusimicrobia bacterium RIFCSPLOWO2_01_FULL_60_11]
MIPSPDCNLFSKASSIVLRAFFRDLDKPWSARELVQEGVSLGQASITLQTLERMGYIQRDFKGRNSCSKIPPQKIEKFRSEILKKWTEFYQFSRNKRIFLHDPKRDFLARFKAFMKKAARPVPYALTAFTGAGLLRPYVLNQPASLFVGVAPRGLLDFAQGIQDRLGILRLAEGGNICLAVPYYGETVFKDARTIKGFPVVSNLQLYLDLAGHPSGKEQIDELEKHFKAKGESFV